ncbi:MAG: hypothetical protein ACJ739_17460 [Acidimicrobiales bacterium]
MTAGAVANVRWSTSGVDGRTSRETAPHRRLRRALDLRGTDQPALARQAHGGPAARANQRYIMKNSCSAAAPRISASRIPRTMVVPGLTVGPSW